MADNVLIEVDDAIATITLNRPEAMNAINDELRDELLAAFTRVRDDDAIRCAVVTGAGDRAFSAGADLRARAAAQEKGRGPTPFPVNQPSTFHTFDAQKPLVAAVNGYCLGAGLELALVCDIRLASTKASFGLPEITLGFFPGAGGPQRLPRAIPLAAAMEMLLTGERIDAETALRYGLVTRVLEPDALLEDAHQVAARIARNAPLAVRGLREVIYQGLDMSLDQALKHGGAIRWAIGETEDAKEGPRAFTEKREPRFEGR